MSWGDQNAVWPAAVGSIVRNNLEEIRRGIEERRLAAGLGSFTGIGSAFTAGEITREHMVNIQSAVSTLITNYVDHTDNSGVWTGQTSIPYWTEAGVIAEIGDASRLSVPATQYTFRAWINQQYDILNLLRWTKSINLSYAVLEERYVNEPFDTDWDTTWSNGETSFASASWSSTLVVDTRPTMFANMVDDVTDYAILSRIRGKLSCSSLYAGLAHSSDWYAWISQSVLDTFHDEGIYTAETYYRYESGSPVTAASETSGYFNDTTTPPTKPTPTNNLEGWASPDVTGFRPLAVHKWDVTGGFSYIA